MANEKHIELLHRGVAHWNEWRTIYRGEIPDLRGANLKGAVLHGVDFDSAQLYKANLSRATLTNAKFRGTSLGGANLSRADMRMAHFGGAHLGRADLSGALLSRARLRGVNLYGATLTDADLTEAELAWTVFGSVDLSRVKGLGEVRHTGPCTVGVDTLSTSRGMIPRSFLRGCGVPNHLIERVLLFHKEQSEFFSCFISYSHADQNFARELYSRLTDRGIGCWMDEKDMLPGDELYDEVARGIRLWDKVLLCCSRHSLTSWWVNNEITAAFEKERQLMEERGEKVLALIPLNLDGYLFSENWEDGKALQVRSRLAADFTACKPGDRKFEYAIERVIQALRSTDSTGAAFPSSKE